MSEDTRPTRRRVLSGLAVALSGGALAGCTGGAGRDDTPVPTSGGSQAVADRTTETTTTTPTTAVESTPAYDFDDPAAAFEALLSDRFVPVESVDVTDGRVQLTYVARSDRGHEVAAGIETVVVSYLQVYRHGWDVHALDATALDSESGDNVMGRWRLESRWVEQTLHDDWTRTDLLERTLDSYHGELRQEDHETDHSHS